ncbi:DUF192 domain-containing protein [Magnetospira sp. QH-2]|uniref:DUF192 domain-containing protein n=1 Tax=Magnetospira sp. (strain QH-2) TaxID=1288970 RepID=UPI0003E81831|nr:DUF192 domain-containing protein [Magnetospira sp. QH-2]CCQ73932.1 Conserved exported protein of unknown function [Magnetospira sp. QH-2]
MMFLARFLSLFKHPMVLLLAVMLLAAQGPVRFDWSKVVIESGDKRHEVQVEMAVSPDQRARGLMFREHMPEGTGMLFDFKTPRNVAMWMKNTLISLDMVFIDSHGGIVAVEHSTQPGSQRMIEAGQPVRAVLELPAGTARRQGIAVGDHVRHDMFMTGGN